MKNIKKLFIKILAVMGLIFSFLSVSVWIVGFTCISSDWKWLLKPLVYPSLIGLVSAIVIPLLIFELTRENKGEYKIERFLAKIPIFFLGVLILFGLYFITTARAGRCGSSMDVSIKADASSLRASAELYASNNNESYMGFCSGADALRAREGIVANESELICNDTEKTWAACAQLKSVAADYYCVDSTGFAKEVRGQCNENWKYTKCPEN